MKKNNKSKITIIILSVIIAILLFIVILLAVLLAKRNNKEVVINTDAIYMGTSSDRLKVETGTFIKDYELYEDYFDSNILKESDFSNNNYVVVEVMFDSCAEKNIKLNSYNLDGKVLNVSFTYEAVCGGCAPSFSYYLIPVAKDVEEVSVNVDYKSTNNPNCPRDVAYKPIIYLYPEEEMNISVKLLNSKYLTTTYPKYNDSWNVLAKPNGDLIDFETGRYLYGLYWEGNNHYASIKEDGFIVKGEDTLAFLEEKLAILGLTEREADEFIIYWLPKLEANKYNYIRFETMEEINNYMPLLIDPTPDTVIRVLMSYKPLEEEIEVKKQVLDTVKREGFTVVEWGGTEIK